MQAKLRDLLRERLQQVQARKVAKDSTAEIAALLRKIQNVQEQQCLLSTGMQAGSGVHSLQYLATLTSDLTKLITVCYQKADLPPEKLRALFAEIEPQNEQPLVSVAGELFQNFVAFERATRANVLAVIKDRIWVLMDAKERSELFSDLVRKFLSKPESTFSQKSVVDSLDLLRIPASDLIQFLSQTLGLRADQDPKAELPAPAKPLVMVSSILILTIRELQRADTTEETAEGAAGQRAFHRIQNRDLVVPRSRGKVKDAQKGSSKVPGSPVKDEEEAAKNPSSGDHSSGTESDDAIDDLEPLEVQRSLTVPISGPKGSLRPANFSRAALAAPDVRAGSKAGSGGACLDEDAQLLAVFGLSVWICKRPDEVLSRPEKAALLVHAIHNMNILSKRARSVSSLAQMVQLGQGDLLELCIAVLCLGEPKLLQGLQTLLERRITHPHALEVVSKY